MKPLWAGQRPKATARTLPLRAATPPSPLSHGPTLQGNPSRFITAASALPYGDDGGGGLSRPKLPRRTLQRLRGDTTAESDAAAGTDLDPPMSLAALSRSLEQQRTAAQQEQPEQRLMKEKARQSKTCNGRLRPPPPAAAAAVAAAAASGSVTTWPRRPPDAALAPAALQPLGWEPGSAAGPVHPNPNPAPELNGNPNAALDRNPPVAFRTAAELRHLLRERQAAAAAAAAAAAQVTPSSSPGAGAAAAAAPAAALDDFGSSGAGSGAASTAPSAATTAASTALAAAAAATAVPATGPSGLTAMRHVPAAATNGTGGSSSALSQTAAAAAAAAAAESSTAEAQNPDLEEDPEYQKAKRHALTLLQRAPLPERELGRRLAARGAPARVVAPLLAWLVAGGALNDRLYARQFAQSKWNSSLVAPTRIKKELTAQGLGEEDVAAALAHVFGPSRRIRLTGPATAGEREVREALLEGARKHVGKRGAGEGGAGDEGVRATAGGRGGGWAAAVAASKEQNAKRRRLAMWLQYRGHDMDLVVKFFELLNI